MTAPTVHLAASTGQSMHTFPFKWDQKPELPMPSNPKIQIERSTYQRISRNTVMCNLMVRIWKENRVMRQSIIRYTSRNIASMVCFLTKYMHGPHCMCSPTPTKTSRSTRLSLSPPGLEPSTLNFLSIAHLTVSSQ